MAEMRDTNERWAVMVIVDGEPLDETGRVWKTRVQALLRREELRRSFPHHDIKIFRGVTVWTEEAA